MTNYEKAMELLKQERAEKHRTFDDTGIICITKVTDNEKNGTVLNPPVDGGYYISYASVDDAEIGDTIITYCVYNPFSNYDDDVMGNAEQMIENARKTIEKSAGVNPLYKEAC